MNSVPKQFEPPPSGINSRPKSSQRSRVIVNGLSRSNASTTNRYSPSNEFRPVPIVVGYDTMLDRTVGAPISIGQGVNTGKRGREELSEEEEEEEFAIEEITIKKKQSRRSFTLQQKLSYVMEYKNYVSQHSSNVANQDQQDGNTEKSKKCGGKPAKMSSWLRMIKERDGVTLAKATFSRWFNEYGKGVDNESIAQEYNSAGKLKRKRKRTRPFHEMESILVQIIQVRNQRLRRENKPVSTTIFIRKKAEMLFTDLYGEDVSGSFKCSNGWLCRFLEFYRESLDPNPNPNNSQYESSEHEQGQLPQPHHFVMNHQEYEHHNITPNHRFQQQQQQQHHYHHQDKADCESHHNFLNPV
mmetsp:Transcript_21937/g.26871  ORF Transcript_21937/g.26871 Transcript_21937/m.26871 type:complete len:356 (-) Transcript_21937:2242-3309(-)